MINILLDDALIDSKHLYEGLNDIIKPKMKVLIIPFSFRDNQLNSQAQWNEAYGREEGKYYSMLVQPLSKYGIEEEDITWAKYFSDTRESLKRKISQSDIIYFTGGLPHKIFERLEEFNAVELIESFNGIIMGLSAGAMVQINEYHITPDKDYPEFCYYKGLNLIKDFDIEVHYEFDKLQDECIERAIKEKNKRIYTIESNSAIVVMDEEVKLLGKVRKFSKDKFYN